jgi:hypothetical protein
MPDIPAVGDQEGEPIEPLAAAELLLDLLSGGLVHPVAERGLVDRRRRRHNHPREFRQDQ